MPWLCAKCLHSYLQYRYLRQRCDFRVEIKQEGHRKVPDNQDDKVIDEAGTLRLFATKIQNDRRCQCSPEYQVQGLRPEAVVHTHEAFCIVDELLFGGQPVRLDLLYERLLDGVDPGEEGDGLVDFYRRGYRPRGRLETCRVSGLDH